VKLVLAFILGLAACGGGTIGDNEGDRVACARLQTGPFQALVASASRTDPPGIESGAIAYRVTVPGGDGFVFFGANQAGDYGVFLDAAVDVEVTDLAATVIVPSEVTDGSSACGEVARRLVVPMAVGVYDLELSNVGADPVTVVIEPVALGTDG
jgi:hypothetical protein